MTPDQIQGWLQIGVAGFLLLALLLGHRRVWVWGWLAESIEKDRDFWRDIALRSMGHAEQALDVAQRKTDG